MVGVILYINGMAFAATKSSETVNADIKTDVKQKLSQKITFEIFHSNAEAEAAHPGWGNIIDQLKDMLI